ncbi:MAG: TetR/AcrR family transcriptional regulator [Nocardioides sp.]
MGHHGWQGDPPPTEALARARIIAAATACIDRTGVEKATLSDVAAEVGVTRQTVYRYFAGLAELLHAVAETGAADFVSRMQAHVEGCGEPLDAVVESIVFCLHELPLEPRIGVLLQSDEDLFGRGITSPTGSALGAGFLRGLAVDWVSGGVTDEDLDGLAELMLRLIGSLMQHPSAAPRPTNELRGFLRRWLGPALTADPSPSIKRHSTTTRRR